MINHKKSLITLKTSTPLHQPIPTHQHVFETAIRDMLANLLNISRDEVYLLPQQPGNVIVQVLMPSEIKQQASRIHALFLNSGIEVVSIVEDFNGACLRNIKLKKAILSQENFYQADLSGADLSGADLNGVDLRQANLHSANLAGAFLMGANLHGAILRKANLSGAKLYGSNLSEANLSRADLLWARLDRGNLHNADLHSANLFKTNLSGANLRGANLVGTEMNKTLNLQTAVYDQTTRWH